MESPWLFRAFNLVGSMMPDRAWRSAGLLRRMGPLAGRILGVGAIGLVGSVPNGQSFVANPMQIWCVTEATATLGQTDFGAPGPLDEQASLGDFVIPKKGVFALGRAFFG